MGNAIEGEMVTHVKIYVETNKKHIVCKIHFNVKSDRMFYLLFMLKKRLVT